VGFLFLEEATMNRAERRRQRHSNVDYTLMEKWLTEHAVMPAPHGHIGYQFEFPDKPANKLLVFAPSMTSMERVRAKDDATGNVKQFIEDLYTEPELLKQLRFVAILGGKWEKLDVPGSADSTE
jgi:hypothetical protein